MKCDILDLGNWCAECRLPDGQRIVFRGDSGYFVGALLDYLDSLGHGYLIKVKLKNLTPC